MAAADARLLRRTDIRRGRGLRLVHVRVERRSSRAAEGRGRRTGFARAIRKQAAARRQPRCLQRRSSRKWSAASARCCGNCPARPRCRIFWSTFPRPVWPRACRKSCFSPAARRATASTRNCRSRSDWSGSYHEFGKFVSGIAALPRIVTLHDIQITPVDAKGGYDNLTMDVTAKTYRYIEDEGGGEGGEEEAARERTT